MIVLLLPIISNVLARTVDRKFTVVSELEKFILFKALSYPTVPIISTFPSIFNSPLSSAIESILFVIGSKSA
ncbi:MAG: hypothetical protein RCG15_05125 [Candidatus Rickettsia vulgarisii]